MIHFLTDFRPRHHFQHFISITPKQPCCLQAVGRHREKLFFFCSRAPFCAAFNQLLVTNTQSALLGHAQHNKVALDRPAWAPYLIQWLHQVHGQWVICSGCGELVKVRGSHFGHFSSIISLTLLDGIPAMLVTPGNLAGQRQSARET